MTAKTSKKALRILHLEDDASFARKVKQTLTDAGINVKADHVRSRKDFTQHLAKSPYHIIFLDDHLPDCSGLEALNIVKEMQLHSAVVMLSDMLDEVAIVNSINQGAMDYLLKTNLERLPEVVKHVIRNNQKNKTSVDYQKFFETSPDLLCSCDKEGNFINLNQAWTRVLGYSQKELKAKPFYEFMLADERTAVMKSFFDIVGGNKHGGGDFVACFRTRNDEVRWLQWNMTAQMDGVTYAIVRDITELKRNEIKLSQEQQNLQDAIEQYKAEITKKSLVADTIQDSVVTTDLKGVITSWNKGSERVFGYTQEEAIGQHIEIIYPEKDYKIIQREGSNILLEQESQDFEVQMRRKSGEVFDAKLSLTVSRDNNGKVNGMVGYAVDRGKVLSAVPQPETVAVPSSQIEKRLNVLIDKGPVIVFACDIKDVKKLIYISSGIEQKFGLSVAHCLEQADFFLNQVHPDDYDKIQDVFKILLENGSFSFTHRLKTADGEYRRVQNELQVIKDNNGEAVEIAGLLLDIDDQFNSEQQLEEDRHKLQQMQQKLQSAEQEMDNYAHQLRHVESKAEQLEEQLRQSEQKLKQQIVAVPVVEHGDTSDDETESTSFDDLEIQLQAAMQEVERANQTKSQFLSSISHELRIALNAVLGFTQVLTLDDGLNDKQKNYLDEITQAGNHLLKVVSSVIDLVKLETGKSELNNESIDVFELVRQCIEQLADKAQEKNITVSATNPDVVGSVFAYADKERLKQVVLHTISNAIKYSNQKANIEVQCSTTNGDAKIGIKNTGADFAKAVQDPLLSNASEQIAQNGGLSSPRIELLITNTLLELMGGTIQYVFDPEKVVEILVPEANVEENEPVIPKIEALSVTDDGAMKAQSNEPAIIYIEDNPANIRLVETLLTQRPRYRLVASQNPENAVELVRTYKPVLILLDMNLPNCNGYDVLSKLKQESDATGVPVVAVSTEAVRSDVEQALQSGFSDYLSKPMEINKFLSAIDALLAPSQADNVQQLNVQ